MEELNLLDLVYSDTFCEIQNYLDIKDLFSLRCVNTELRQYIDKELIKLKKLQIPAKSEKFIDAYKILSGNCCKIEQINLNRNDWLTDELLIPLLSKNSRTLTSLRLNDCLSITSVALHFIIDCVKLKKLSLHNCYWLTDGCLETIAFHQGEKLEELDLTNCLTISENCIIILLNRFRKLRVLSLASVANVNDNVLFSISKYQNEIVHLNLFSCKSVTDRGIGALSLNCKKLEALSIRGCGNITEGALAPLRSRNVSIDIPRNPSNIFINQYQQNNAFACLMR